jgi:hypothetical protein
VFIVQQFYFLAQSATNCTKQDISQLNSKVLVLNNTTETIALPIFLTNKDKFHDESYLSSSYKRFVDLSSKGSIKKIRLYHVDEKIGENSNDKWTDVSNAPFVQFRGFGSTTFKNIINSDDPRYVFQTFDQMGINRWKN